MYWVRIAGASAILAAGVVSYGQAGSQSSSGKLFEDRLPAGSEPVTADCGHQTWPYLSGDCVESAQQGGAYRPVRFITIQMRDGPNVSTLVRVPASASAGP